METNQQVTSTHQVFENIPLRTVESVRIFLVDIKSINLII